MTLGWRVKERTAVALVSGVVLLLAVPFAFLAWAFGGGPELLAFAFALPLAVLVGLIVVITVRARRFRSR